MKEIIAQNYLYKEFCIHFKSAFQYNNIKVDTDYQNHLIFYTHLRDKK